MDIDKVLNAMKIKHECIGNTSFESLGLIHSKASLKLCTFAVDAQYAQNLQDNISVLLTTKEMGNVITDRGVCIVEDPRYTFFLMHNYLCNDEHYVRENRKTKIGENSQISRLAYIAENNVRIGKNVIIEEFVSIKENVTIGDNCIIRAGTIIGGSGFEQKRHGASVLSVNHAGGVIIGDNVELQQDNCVDRAIYPWDNTEIGDYCRTDNKVHIAHAVKMQKRVLIAACTCVAGRVEIEDDVWIGPGVTLINGMHIGKAARVNIGSVATKDVESKQAVTGNFAVPHEKFIQHVKNIDNISHRGAGGGTK